jgi:lysophospholipase L1-like esterase
LVDAGGNLSPTLQDGDGIHLNSAGNRIWIDELRNAIGKALHRGT